MKDLFGEFLEELRRRQEAEAARARGEEPADPANPQEEPTPLKARRTGNGAGGGGNRPPRHAAGGPRDGERSAGGRFRLATSWVVAGVVLLVVMLGGFVLDLWTDAIWFKSVGYDPVFWTRVGTQAALFAGGTLVALLFFALNIAIAGRLSPEPGPDGVGGTISRFFERLNDVSRMAPDDFTGRGQFGTWRPEPRDVSPQSYDLPDFERPGRWLLAAGAVVLAIGVGATVANSWETIQLFLHRVPYAAGGAPVVDPIFGRDISFFLFDLPFLRLAQSLANGILVTAIVLTGARYLLAGLRGDLTASTAIRVHVAFLAGLYLVSMAAGYQLDKFELTYAANGVATGVAYADANARFLGLDVLTVIAALTAAFLVGAAFTRMVWPLGMAVGVWLVASAVLGSIYPSVIQRITVEPNQFALERPYIKNNIDMTRLAYGLDSWKQENYGGEAPLTAATVAAEQPTFASARVWDYRPLRDLIDQVQTVRQYYDFTDVDTDRYLVGGIERQVMLSARELAPEKNPQASSWVNQKLTFTHGVGAVMVPVNEASAGGQPTFYLRDLPPVAAPQAPKIDQFRIYFGERPSDWVVVGARQNEFDYPVGSDANAEASGSGQQTRWTGTTGVRIDTTLTRLLFAARFADLNLLISDQITNESQLLFHRSLADRLGLIAPFLKYDKDPYLVVREDGSLAWIQDAFTVSDRFPNAEAFDPTSLPSGSGLGASPINYLRNSVKIVENAYDGTLTFYVSDPSDPIIRAYEGVFPSLFRPFAEMPADLVPHVRVPEELFNVQTRMFATYHVTDPSPFYNREDLWMVPSNAGSDQTLPSEAYYVQMRTPGGKKPEFLLLQPMVPQRRPNMIAWVAARNDQADYGKVLVYQFAENTSVLGPNQIEAKIDADPTISAQFSLWNQSGSKVIRGNLIVLPVQDSLIYLQPIYLQSTSSAFPELQKVIVATSDKVVWGDTLADALDAQLAGTPGGGGSGGGGGTPSPTPAPSASPGASPTPAPTAPAADVAGLIAYANEHFATAESALRAGDFATYGTEIALVRDALARLATLTASPSPAP